MITERMEVGKIEILVDGQIQLREDTVVERDGVQIARTYHRRVLEPGMDVSDHADKRLATITSVLWTPEVVQDFQTQKASRAANAGPGLLRSAGLGKP